MKVLPRIHWKFGLWEAPEYHECILGVHPLIWMRTWKMLKNSVGWVPNQKHRGDQNSKCHLFSYQFCDHRTWGGFVPRI
jgi:hypothetical protein